LNLIYYFFSIDLIVVFFVNGLAFFAMGLAVSLEARRPSTLKLSESLWLLAAFAYLRSLANWTQMSVLIQRQAVPSSYNPPLEAAKVLLHALSCLFLLQFGVKTIITARRRHHWLRWVVPVLGLLWLFTLIPAIRSSGANSDLLLVADVYHHYVLWLPASVLSALAMLLHGRILWEMEMPHIARNCIGAAVAFGLEAVFAALIADRAPFFPASVVNEATFLDAVGVPVQVFRTITTVAIAYFFVRILRVFEIEQARRLAAANQRNIQAQIQALEAQCRACEEIENWSKALEDMISAIAMAMSQPVDLTELLSIARDKVLELTGLESCMVFLADDQKRELRLVEYEGMAPKARQDLGMIRFGEGLAGRVALSGEPIVVEDASQDPRLISTLARETGLRFMASLPLKSRGRLLGVINLASTSRHAFKPQEVAVLIAIGQQVAVAIDNARLHEQLQSMAALEERSRIGRELHDGLAQVLGYLHMKSNAAESLLSSGQVAQAQVHLHEMQEVARESYQDVRESILGLRTTITPGTGLIPTLTEYLHKFSQQSGISARLVVGDDVETEIAPLAEIQFLRIIQEALTNVRKHSQATRAWVRVETVDGQTLVTVEDDGQGFDPSLLEQDGMDRFGLETMRERAESVGGVLEVATQPGGGTRLTVQLPISAQGGE
jgi:signal transduction histidine kinase